MADQTKKVQEGVVDAAEEAEARAPGAADHSGANLQAPDDDAPKRRSGKKLPAHVQRAFDEGGSVLTHHTDAGTHTAASEDELPDGWDRLPKKD